MQMDGGGSEYDDLLQRVRELQNERGMGAIEAAATVWTESGRDGSIRSFSRLVLTQCVLPNRADEGLIPKKIKTERRNEVSSTEQTITSNSETDVSVELSDAKSAIKMKTYEKNQIDLLIKRLENKKNYSEVKLNDKSKNVYNNAYKQEFGETDQRSTTRSQHDSRVNLKVRFSANDDVRCYCSSEIGQDEHVQREEECSDAEPQLSPKLLALAESLSSKLEQLREDDEALVAAKLDELRVTVNRSSCSPAALQVNKIIILLSCSKELLRRPALIME